MKNLNFKGLKCEFNFIKINLSGLFFSVKYYFAYFYVYIFYLDTLGTLFKSLYVKGDEFQLVEDVLNLTMTITEQKNCGELRSGLYSMLSDCSEFMKEKMESYFPRILKLMTISFHEIDTTVRGYNFTFYSKTPL